MAIAFCLPVKCTLLGGPEKSRAAFLVHNIRFGAVVDQKLEGVNVAAAMQKASGGHGIEVGGGGGGEV